MASELVWEIWCVQGIAGFEGFIIKRRLHLHNTWDPHSSTFTVLNSEKSGCHSFFTCCQCLFFPPSLINYFLHICFFLWGFVSWPYCQRLLDCNMPCIRISKALHSIGKHKRVLHVLWNNKRKQRKRACSSLPCYFEHMLKMLTNSNTATQSSHNKEL